MKETLTIAFGWPIASILLPLFILALALKIKWLKLMISLWILLSLFIDAIWTKHFGWGSKGDMIQIPCAFIAFLYFLIPSKKERRKRKWKGRR